jgi:hypothetical protein
MRRLVAAAIPFLALLAFLVSCEKAAEETGTSISPTTTASPTDDTVIGGGGGSPPQYAEPVLLVAGEYKPPSASPEAREKFQQAIAAEAGKPQFNGVVNGFRLYGWEDAAADPSLEQKECVSESFPEVDRLEFTYLPAGTSALTPQYAGICADGSTAWVVQELAYLYGAITIGYETGERAIGTDAPAGRVSEATIAGKPGVIIRPITEEGNGQSIVALPLGSGFIIVGAEGLPIDETVKIADGVKCAGC